MILYLLTNKITKKRYVGQTIDSLDNRWDQHKSKNSSCRLLKRSMDKHGSDNFDRKIISRCNSMEEMNHRETYYIKLFNTLAPNGYNLTTGGNNRIPSDETRARMSASNKGIKRPKSAEQARRLSIARIGTKQSQEQKDKKARALFQPIEVPELGIVFNSYKEASEALGTHNHVIRNVINGIKSDWKGLTFKQVSMSSVKDPSSEALELLRVFVENKKHGWVGKKRSLEENERNRLRQQRPIFCPQINKNFDSIKIAAKELGLQASGIGMVCRGKSKQTGGYTFKYLYGNNK